MGNGLGMPKLGSGIKTVGLLATTAVLITTAALWPGYDSQELVLNDGSVWVVQNSEQSRYAKINPKLGELITVKSASGINDVLQNSSQALLLFAGNRSLKLDSASPAEISETELSALPQPPFGTRDFAINENYLVYLTAEGLVYYGVSSRGEAAGKLFTPTPVKESEAGQDRQLLADQFVAKAIALNSEDQLYIFGEQNQQGVLYQLNLSTDSFSELSRFDYPVSTTEGFPQLALSAEGWALLSPDATQFWVSGLSEPQAISLNGEAYLAKQPSKSEQIFLVDSAGAYQINSSTSEITELISGSVSGAAVQPVTLNGVNYAAWLSETLGQIWDSQSGELRFLDYSGEVFESEAEAKFRINGETVVLNETQTGFVWKVPSGELIQSSKDWVVADSDSGVAPGEQIASVVTDPKAPTAAPDHFQIRAGQTIRLPVLLNDSDPNRDVLTIIPESITELDSSFGQLYLSNNQQEIVAQIFETAKGTAQFKYAVTDGSGSNGLNSKPTTVTLSLKTDESNSAPVWCGVTNCLASWPAPQLLSGGSISIDVLSNWVDPDGDPIFLDQVSIVEGPGSVAWTSQGELNYSHPDAQVVADSVLLRVTVKDLRGASATKDLRITITAAPILKVQPFVVQTVVTQELLIDPTNYISASSGAVFLADPKLVSTEKSQAEVSLSSDAKKLRFTSKTPGSYLISYSVVDAVSTERSWLRVVVTESGKAALAVNPIVAFVTGSDETVIDLAEAISNPVASALTIVEAEAKTELDSNLVFQVVGATQLKISGARNSAQAGKLGTIDFRISTGDSALSNQAYGQIVVYSKEQQAPAAPVLVDDYLTVRAGALVDIPVLANDFGVGTGALSLSKELEKESVNDPGLAFVSGNLVRYLAPKEAGEYRIFYRAYNQTTPDQTALATIHITVVANSGNTAPEAKDLSARVISGESVNIPVPLSGVDPEGDRVIIDRILTQPERGIAAISSDGSSLLYTSSSNHSGQISFEYQLRDEHGATASAKVKVSVVTQLNYRSGIIANNDYLNVALGSGRVNVSPLGNDSDPAGNRLYLIAVEPGVHPDSENYSRIAAQIGAISSDFRTVSLSAGTVPGTIPFVYTVANQPATPENPIPESAIRAQIFLTVTESSAVDAPQLADTVLDLETRAEFLSGVDVISSKLSWASGDISELTLSLLTPNDNLKVTGRKISGTLSENYQLIPFKVSAPATSQRAAAEGYGFLHVPGENDLRLSLKSELKAIEVLENEQIELELSELIAAPAGSSLEFDQSTVKTSGARAGSSCSLTGSTISYSAGLGEPWRDFCQLAVKLSSQSEYSWLAVPIRVLPVDPVPTLSRSSLELLPGQSKVFKFSQAASWEDPQNTSDQVQYSYRVLRQGSLLPELASSASGVTEIPLHLHAGAKPGSEIVIELSAQLGDYRVTEFLYLSVGLAPPHTPKGGIFEDWVCSNRFGTVDCELPVIGVAGSGEDNPFDSRYPLALVGADPVAANCPEVHFSIEDDRLNASWSQSSPGYRDCTVSFFVEDAQGRIGSGLATFTLEGKAQTVASIEQIGYGINKARLRINRGTASYPVVESYRVRYQDLNGVTQEQQCKSNSEVCILTLDDLVTGGISNPTEVQVVAYNGVQESEAKTFSAVAYRRSQNPTLNLVRTVYESSYTTQETGVLELQIQNNDPQVSSYRFLNSAGTQLAVNSSTATAPGTISVHRIRGLNANSEPQITVSPVNPLGSEPTGRGNYLDGSTGSVLTVSGQKVAGTVKINTSQVQVQVSETQIVVNQLSVDSNGASAASTQTRYLLFGPYLTRNLALSLPVVFPNCNINGGITDWHGATNSNSFSLLGSERYRYFRVGIVGTNEFGCSTSLLPDAYFSWNQPEAPSGFEYSVAATPAGTIEAGAEISYLAQLRLPDPAGTNHVLSYSDTGTTPPSASQLPFGTAPQLSAAYCLELSGAVTSNCSDSATISRAADSAVEYQIKFALPAQSSYSCADNPPALDNLGLGSAQYSLDWTETGSYRISWLGDWAALDGIVVDTISCTLPTTPENPPAELQNPIQEFEPATPGPTANRSIRR